jgi:hypothetical protein
MPRKWLPSLLVLAVITPAAAQQTIAMRAAAQPDSPTVGAEARVNMRLAAESRIWVEGTSTVRSYTCEAKQVNETIRTRGAGAVRGIGDLHEGVTNVHLSIAVLQMDCGDRQMDGHMRKALKFDEHPYIKFNLNTRKRDPMRPHFTELRPR